MKKSKCAYCGNIQDYDLKFCTICTEEMSKNKFTTQKKIKLIDKSKDSNEVIAIACKNCPNQEAIEKWGTRTVIGILLLLAGGILPGLYVFFGTNPYICSSCGEREHLTKIYNNGAKLRIRSNSKTQFLVISISALILLILAQSISLGKYRAIQSDNETFQNYNSYYTESDVEKDLSKMESSFSVADDGLITYNGIANPNSEFGKLMDEIAKDKIARDNAYSQKFQQIGFDPAVIFDSPNNLKDIELLSEVKKDIQMAWTLKKVHTEKNQEQYKTMLIEGEKALKSDLPMTWEIEYKPFKDTIETEQKWNLMLYNMRGKYLKGYLDYIQFHIDNNAKIAITNGKIVYDTESLYQESQELFDALAEAESKYYFYLEQHLSLSKGALL